MSKKLSHNKAALEMLKYLTMDGLTDDVIIQKLFEKFGHRWTRNAIYLNRKKLGMVKGKSNGDVSKEIGNVADKTIDGFTFSRPPANLSNDAKANWFRDQFKNSHLYSSLHTQFNDNEISVYMQEYGIICCQFEDLVASEFFQIDDFLKHRILINRQLVEMRNIQEEIAILSKWMKDHPKDNCDTPEIVATRVDTMRSIDIKRAALNKTSERYDSLVSERDKIHKALAATRRDRIDELKNNTTNFLDLVLSIQQSESARQRHGKYAELTRIASNRSLKKMREEITFPDGSIDAIIIDGESDE